MHKFATALIAATALTVFAAPVKGQIAERLPTGDYYNTWTDVSEGQNFLTQIVLGSDATLGSMTIYTQGNLVNVGDSTTLRIRADASGFPSDTNLFEVVTPIASLGTTSYDGIVTASVDFAPISLSAGTYWIGLSGTGDTSDLSDIGWSSFQNEDAIVSYQSQLNGETVAFTPGIYTLAYSIGGFLAPDAVPEPATWEMMFLGFAALGVAVRKANRPTIRQRLLN